MLLLGQSQAMGDYGRNKPTDDGTALCGLLLYQATSITAPPVTVDDGPTSSTLASRSRPVQVSKTWSTFYYYDCVVSIDYLDSLLEISFGGFPMYDRLVISVAQ